MLTTRRDPRCPECGRTFDMADPSDAGEWYAGHDCESEYVSRCPACGDPIDYCQGHGEIGDPAGFAILEAHDADDHAGCIGECRTVTGADILAAVRAAGREAFVAQTGGGCATVYVGEPDADGRYDVAIGPGVFDWADSARSRFWPADLYIGPDDDGEAEPVCVTDLRVITDYLTEGRARS